MMTGRNHFWEWQKKAKTESGDPTARRNQPPDTLNGSERFQEWSKRRLAFLERQAQPAEVSDVLG